MLFVNREKWKQQLNEYSMPSISQQRHFLPSSSSSSCQVFFFFLLLVTPLVVCQGQRQQQQQQHESHLEDYYFKKLENGQVARLYGQDARDARKEDQDKVLKLMANNRHKLYRMPSGK